MVVPPGAQQLNRYKESQHLKLLDDGHLTILFDLFDEARRDFLAEKSQHPSALVENNPAHSQYPL